MTATAWRELPFDIFMQPTTATRRALLLEQRTDRHAGPSALHLLLGSNATPPLQVLARAVAVASVDILAAVLDTLPDERAMDAVMRLMASAPV